MPDHGIEERDLETIRGVLAPYADGITRVDVFGSRATGRHRKNSDIDLAVFGDISRAAVDRIRTLFIESRLPVRVDLVRHADIAGSSLQAHINAVGRRLLTGDQLGTAGVGAEAPRRPVAPGS